MLRRRFAESSRVRSSHWLDAVNAAFCRSFITKRESEAIRSERMGLRLYAIAEEPICFASNGSSTSLRCDSRRMSLENFDALCAMPESTCKT